MDTDTIIIRIDDGAFAGFECVNPAIRRAAIVTDGFTERVAAGRLLVTENDIAEAVRVVRGCELTGAWQGLDAGCEVVVEAERRSAEVSAQLAELLHVPIADRVPDLRALLDDIERSMPMIEESERHHENALAALRQFKTLLAHAADAYGAAHGGHHQQPLMPSANERAVTPRASLLKRE